MVGRFRKFLAGLGLGKAQDDGAVPASVPAAPEPAPPPAAPPALRYTFDVKPAQPMERLIAAPWAAAPRTPPKPLKRPPRNPPAPPVEAPPPQFDATPDLPEPFGYKVCWFAVRASDPAQVLDALGWASEGPANWHTGIAAAYRRTSGGQAPWVFASPPVEGWVLLVGGGLPYPAVYPEDRLEGIGQAFDVIFTRLKDHFGEAQFFGSHRVADFVAWARARRGEPGRQFSYAGSSGEVYANVGVQSAEEAALGFAVLSGLSPVDARDRLSELLEEEMARKDALVASGMSRRDAGRQVRPTGRSVMPGEEDVTALADAWSVDPTRLDEADRGYVPGVGLMARVPTDLGQEPVSPPPLR